MFGRARAGGTGPKAGRARALVLTLLTPVMKSPRNLKTLLLLKSALFGGLLVGAVVLAPAQQPGTAIPAPSHDSRRTEAQVETLLNQLTLEEKVNYLVG